MPNRIIRESSRWSHSLARLSNAAARSWWSLNTVFDDFGRYYGDEQALYAAAFPIRSTEMTPRVFAKSLRELVAVDCIRFYESEGRRYVYVPSWDEHQQRRAKSSKFPEPANICAQVPTNVPVVEVVVGVGIDPPIAPQPRGASIAEQFEEFYTAYPIHKARNRAERAFRAALKGGATLVQMLAAIQRQKAERESPAPGQFIPEWKHPASWLNAGCWQDEPTGSPEPELSEAEKAFRDWKPSEGRA